MHQKNLVLIIYGFFAIGALCIAIHCIYYDSYAHGKLNQWI